MEEKLNKLFNESISELKSIGINVEDEQVGKIDIKFSRKSAKRYGCCKQDDPDKSTRYIKNRGVYYSKFNSHHIEISPWIMDLKDSIIKNTIIHELIHCLPDCNNHGRMFKYYAKRVNDNLGYNITRLGNKKEDYEKSNLVYKGENANNKYKIVCSGCGQTYFRQRISKYYTLKYVCGICKNKLIVTKL